MDNYVNIITLIARRFHSMTFSTFAKMMYPFIGNAETSSDFVISLTNLVMKASHDGQDVDDYNPLSKYKPNTLAKYYNGERNIPKNIATEIIKHMDITEFRNKIDALPFDTLLMLDAELKRNKVEIDDINDIINTCSDLFESILYNCANKSKTRDKRTQCEKLIGYPKKCNISLDAFIQMQREHGRWNFFKEHNKESN